MSYYWTFIDESNYDPWQPSTHRIQVLPVRCSLESPNSARPPQGFEQSHRPLLDPIVNGQSLCYRRDDKHSPTSVLVHDQSVDAHHKPESYLTNLVTFRGTIS